MLLSERARDITGALKNFDGKTSDSLFPEVSGVRE